MLRTSIPLIQISSWSFVFSPPTMLGRGKGRKMTSGDRFRGCQSPKFKTKVRLDESLYVVPALGSHTEDRTLQQSRIQKFFEKQNHDMRMSLELAGTNLRVRSHTPTISWSRQQRPSAVPRGPQSRVHKQAHPRSVRQSAWPIANSARAADGWPVDGWPVLLTATAGRHRRNRNEQEQFLYQKFLRTKNSLIFNVLLHLHLLSSIKFLLHFLFALSNFTQKIKKHPQATTANSLW